jgi:glycerol-3-phosphate cytidylyltransferase
MIIGFTCGAFDLLHPGHLAMFRECRKKCDYLIVGLHTDPTTDRSTKNKPVQSMFERWSQLNACSDVSEIIPYSDEYDLANLLATVDINIRFIGSDHIGGHITGKDICGKRNIDIYYNERYHNYSSSELRDRLK